jgi:hypothetical protein
MDNETTTINKKRRVLQQIIANHGGCCAIMCTDCPLRLYLHRVDVSYNSCAATVDALIPGGEDRYQRAAIMVLAELEIEEMLKGNE